MKTIIGLIIILFTCCQLNAQIKVPVKIDTTQRKNLALYQFLNTYMQQRLGISSKLATRSAFKLTPHFAPTDLIML